MGVWAIGDLHLSFGVPNKKMDLFGKKWENHADKIAANWKENIQPDDLVLIPGDISWAMRLEEVKPDLEWIHSLPGTKVMIRGNHDYWWSSKSKIEKILPSSIHVIQNDLFHWNNLSIAGSRLWDTTEYNFAQYIESTGEGPEIQNQEENQRIFDRELIRLELSLKGLEKESREVRLAMTHYPPIDATLCDSAISRLLEKYGVSVCVFGHLHNVKAGTLGFGQKNGVRYVLTSCDYLDFNPIKIL